jgi:hypothetical protein
MHVCDYLHHHLWHLVQYGGRIASLAVSAVLPAAEMHVQECYWDVIVSEGHWLLQRAEPCSQYWCAAVRALLHVHALHCAMPLQGC